VERNGASFFVKAPGVFFVADVGVVLSVKRGVRFFAEFFENGFFEAGFFAGLSANGFFCEAFFCRFSANGFFVR
jgi:hypothetical protein